MERRFLTGLSMRRSFCKLAVLYSGDTGFYSGASGLAETLRERQKAGKDQEIQLEILPGISTVSYLASKLQIPWQDLELESLHGREAKPLGGPWNAGKMSFAPWWC